MIADIAEASKGRPVKFAGVGLSAIYVRGVRATSRRHVEAQTESGGHRRVVGRLGIVWKNDSIDRQ